jgi:hypothetical protein
MLARYMDLTKLYFPIAKAIGGITSKIVKIIASFSLLRLLANKHISLLKQFFRQFFYKLETFICNYYISLVFFIFTLLKIFHKSVNSFCRI